MLLEPVSDSLEEGRTDCTAALQMLSCAEQLRITYLVLDAVEREDGVQHSLGLRRCRERIEKASPGMRPGSDAHAAIGDDDEFVARVPIHEEVATRALEHLGRSVPTRGGLKRYAMRFVVRNVAPPRLLLGLHTHGRLVSEDEMALADELENSLDEWLQHLRRGVK